MLNVLDQFKEREKDTIPFSLQFDIKRKCRLILVPAARKE